MATKEWVGSEYYLNLEIEDMKQYIYKEKSTLLNGELLPNISKYILNNGSLLTIKIKNQKEAVTSQNDAASKK